MSDKLMTDEEMRKFYEDNTNSLLPIFEKVQQGNVAEIMVRLAYLNIASENTMIHLCMQQHTEEERIKAPEFYNSTKGMVFKSMRVLTVEKKK